MSKEAPPVFRRLSTPAPIVARGSAVLVVLVGALTAVLWLGGATPARAHAMLQSVSPADGADLGEAPSQVTLRFNEPVSTPRSGVRVLDSTGQAVEDG